MTMLCGFFQEMRRWKLYNICIDDSYCEAKKKTVDENGLNDIDIVGYCRIRWFPTVGYHRILLSESDGVRLSESVGSHRISSVSDYRNPIGSDCRILSDFIGSYRIRWGDFDLRGLETGRPARPGLAWPNPAYRAQPTGPGGPHHRGPVGRAG